MSAIRYTNRAMVLHCLTRLMKSKLSSRERKVIYLRCGMGQDSPVSFRDLATRLCFDTPKLTEAHYDRAVQKTRAAIVGSELENWISRYQLWDENLLSKRDL